MRQKEDGTIRALKQAKNGAILLAVISVIGILLAFFPFHSLHRTNETVEEAPKVTIIPARPSTTPTATPTVNSIKVFAYGTELTADGFTTYVGDRSVVLSVEIEPEIKRPQILWSVSDTESASLVISDDRMSCKYTALKPSGKNELVVSCYGAKAVFPVYLWKR